MGTNHLSLSTHTEEIGMRPNIEYCIQQLKLILEASRDVRPEDLYYIQMIEDEFNRLKEVIKILTKEE